MNSETAERLREALERVETLAADNSRLWREVGRLEKERDNRVCYTLREIGERLKREFPGVHTSIGLATDAFTSGEMVSQLQPYAGGARSIAPCSTIDECFAQIRLALKPVDAGDVTIEEEESKDDGNGT